MEFKYPNQINLAVTLLNKKNMSYMIGMRKGQFLKKYMIENIISIITFKKLIQDVYILLVHI